MRICLGIKNKGYTTVFLSFVVILCIKKTCIAHIALTFINHLFWECLHNSGKIPVMFRRITWVTYTVQFWIQNISPRPRFPHLGTRSRQGPHSWEGACSPRAWRAPVAPSRAAQGCAFLSGCGRGCQDSVTSQAVLENTEFEDLETDSLKTASMLLGK